ncbi:MAG: hypothetical protein FWC18_04895 [Cystobacterineae bacterium]|nr:hypothetical protein [Cystobacterineae bacterium]MCL2259141.1 hypothetical protein [Cystobacterineae bacterium]
MPSLGIIHFPKDTPMLVTFGFTPVRAFWELVVIREGNEKCLEKRVDFGNTVDRPPKLQATLSEVDLPEGTSHAILLWAIKLYAPPAENLDYKINVKCETEGQALHPPVEYRDSLKGGTILTIRDFFTLKLL